MYIINNGDVAFMVITTVLVFVMTPGLALFYGGLMEKKNSITMMMYTMIAIGIVTIMWVLGGFSLVFGSDLGGVIGNPVDYFVMRNVDFTINPNYGSQLPFLMFFMYQLMFAIITAPLMTGAFANRVSIKGWIWLLILWMLFIYFPVAHWVWGGGFLSKMGFVDYAGGSVIHITAAFSGLAAIIYLGKRTAIQAKAYGNLYMVVIGGTLLLFGWFGFNSGGALAGGETAAIAFTNTGVASAFAMITWVILSYIKEKKFSMVELVTGAVAGLATITPASGYVNPQEAALIGIIGALICFGSLAFARKMKWDDALGVWGVHGMGGFSGTIMIGIFALSIVNDVQASTKQFLVQLVGAILIAIYSFVLTWIIIKICDYKGGVRVSPKIQEYGLDQEYLTETIDY